MARHFLSSGKYSEDNERLRFALYCGDLTFVFLRNSSASFETHSFNFNIKEFYGFVA